MRPETRVRTGRVAVHLCFIGIILHAALHAYTRQIEDRPTARFISFSLFIMTVSDKSINSNAASREPSTLLMPEAQQSSSSSLLSIYRSNLFQNQVALVTGGGTGIGKAISLELASLGATVVIASRNHNACRVAAEEMTIACSSSSVGGGGGGGGGRVVAGPSTSIRNEEQVKELIAFILNTFGKLDMLVNNAGGQFVSAAEDLSRNGFAAVVETNLLGTFLVCQQAYLQYMKDNGGRIVNITLGNRNGMPLMVHSGAARAGIENMTATLCTEWMESSIRINCVRPGIIFTDSGFENYGPLGDDFAKLILPSIPAKRFGSPQEVASAVLWLLSEGSSYVTGTVICVDGGSSYTFLPLVDIDSSKSHLPVYGELPSKAKL